MTVDILAPAETELSAKVVIQIGRELGGRRMSQAALARLLDVKPMWVSDRMTGRVRLTIDDLARIADGLDVGIVDLLPSSARGRRTTDGEGTREPVAVGSHPHPNHPLIAAAVPLPRAPHADRLRRSAPTGL